MESKVDSEWRELDSELWMSLKKITSYMLPLYLSLMVADISASRLVEWRARLNSNIWKVGTHINKNGYLLAPLPSLLVTGS
jgi:hypothetical protein